MEDIRSLSVQELCGSRAGRPGLPVPNSPYGLCGRKATLNKSFVLRAQELCGSRGGRPGLPVPNSPYGLCGRKATFKEGNTVPNFMVFCTPTFADDLFVCTQTALTLCVYTAHTQATNLPLI